MQATPYITGGTHRIVLEADKALPKAQQSVFVVAPLSIDEFYSAMDQLTDARFQTLFAVCVRQLREARTFPANAPQPFPVDGPLDAKKQYVALLGPSGVRELGNAILDQAFVTDNGPESD